MRLSIAVGIVALAVPYGAICQSPLAFEVASVKPSDGHLGIDMKTFAHRLSSTCSLRQLIVAAYSVERWQVTGGPVWLDNELFDIEVTTTDDLTGDPDRVTALGRPAPRKMMLMLQTLLAERFNVKVHRETRQENVFTLVVAKGSPRLQPPQETTKSFIGVSRGGFSRTDYDPATAPVIITGHNASMEQFAKFLEGNVGGRPVTDQTGIKGNYDFRIEYSPENSPLSTPPPFFTAFQDATGLKLNAGKGPVEFLVVDHADKPSAN